VIDVQGTLAAPIRRREEFYRNVAGMIEGVKALKIPIIRNEQFPNKHD